MPFPLLPDESMRLQSLREFKVLDTPAEQGFDDLARLAAHICDAPIALVSLVDENRQWFKSKIGLETCETGRDAAFCARTIHHKDLFIVPDATEDARFAQNPLVTGEPFIRFYAGAPLIADDGFALGSLCVIDRRPRELTDWQKTALQMLARQVVAQLVLRRQTVELSRSNQALAQSKENYRVVAESASDVIITIDESGAILFVNPAVEKVLGYKPVDLIEQNLAIIIPERLRAAHLAGMRRYLASGERRIPWTNIELPAVRRDGIEIEVEMSFGENRDNDQRRFTAVIRDCTERKRSAAALRESEERYRLLTEVVPQQVWTARADGRLIYGNRRAVEYYGENSEYKLLGMRWLKIVHPADAESCLAAWTRSVATGEFYENEFRLRRSDGEYRWHLSKAVPVRDAENRIVKWFGTNTDIHERKLADDALRKSEEYRNLFRHASDAILILDPGDETVLDVNDRACETYGIERAAFIGRSLRGLSENAAHGDEQLRRLLAGGVDQEFETVQFRSDKTPVHFSVSSSLIEFDGKPAILSVNRGITERKRHEAQLRHDAFHDSLTGLPNRALFMKYLRLTIERSRREQNRLFAVLFLDFDRFKVVNDSLGHTQGDKLLVMLARRLETVLRPNDSVARIGGDEFTILLDGLNEPTHAVNIAERLQQHLRQPFELSGRPVSMTASIGIALSADRAPSSAEEMLRDADLAMYRAKAEGKARHRVFDRAMHAEAVTQLDTEIELRRALERNEFCLHYQPIVDLAIDRLVGFESLIRWRHPARGMVSPAEFIPAAEENDLIIGIGEFTLRESCRQLREWQLQNRGAGDLTISVNLSCKQFLQIDLAARIRRALAETELAPQCLKLEITESHVMENHQSAVETMNELRALGVEFSLDDFGTGYSSLSYLHRLPASFLKIDRSFVVRMNESEENYQIVRTIINLAQNLKKKVVAEGIETIEQLNLLKQLGCDYGQGYLLSKPVAAEFAAELIIGKPAFGLTANAPTCLELIG